MTVRESCDTWAISPFLWLYSGPCLGHCPHLPNSGNLMCPQLFYKTKMYIPTDKISSHFFINYWRRKERESCIKELGSTNRGRLAQEWDKQAWSSNITKWGFSTSTEGRIANLCTDPNIAKTYTCRNICVCAPWRFQNLLILIQNLVKTKNLAWIFPDNVLRNRRFNH